MCALEVLYSSEKHSIKKKYFFPSQSGLTSKDRNIPRVARILCLIKDSRGAASCNCVFL